MKKVHLLILLLLVPGFVCLAREPLRLWCDVTAMRGVALYMHYSGVWDTRAIELHPEWAVTNADGKPDKDKTSVFGPYADKLLIPQLKELAGDSVSQLDGKRMIHLVNTSGDHKGAGIIRSIDPAGPLQITVRCDRKPSRITLRPSEKVCDFSWSDGKAQLKVDAVEIYDILVIE